MFALNTFRQTLFQDDQSVFRLANRSKFESNSSIDEKCKRNSRTHSRWDPKETRVNHPPVTRLAKGRCWHRGRDVLSRLTIQLLQCHRSPGQAEWSEQLTWGPDFLTEFKGSAQQTANKLFSSPAKKIHLPCHIFTGRNKMFPNWKYLLLLSGLFESAVCKDLMASVPTVHK